ncbi:hypothetical protein I6H08_02855 [Burkholderia gladioli]|uniref:hypothetical protein n=1 Tax=Burkholderia gladioli TaxID=28095 RepID=UPI000B1194E0|nr:hypothetical protein [Burkholderia gladioli]QPQ84047.1 hypothetical protein I6H08_02855 [Burkholderia gladioli]
MNQIELERCKAKRKKRVVYLTLAWMILCALPGMLFFNKYPILGYLSGASVTLLFIVGCVSIFTISHPKDRRGCGNS